MSTYEPGTVAAATVRGVPNVRVFRGEGFWRTATDVGGNVTHWDYNGGATDVRPLVVLDLDAGYLGDGQLLIELRRDGYLDLADQIEQQTKPPRIPEPGLWGVVEDKDGYYWVSDEPGRWTRTADGRNWAWVDIESPTLIRDGIEGAS